MERKEGLERRKSDAPLKGAFLFDGRMIQWTKIQPKLHNLMKRQVFSLRHVTSVGKRRVIFMKKSDIFLDLSKRELEAREGKIKLTKKECQLLALFLANPGKVLTRKVLMKEVWETDYLGDTRTLDVHICWLRGKLRRVGASFGIRTVRGVGYRFSKAG
jgi:DNA-binding response OmpR family regulator